MVSRYLSNDFGFLNLFRNIKYRIDFNKEHPYYFKPSGTCIFCGAQGFGKTLSAVSYIEKILSDYPFAILVTNVELKSYPFNAYFDYDTMQIVRYDYTSCIQTVIEYDGLDSLKYLQNGEFGVIYFIDELHLELNSLESKNIDVDVMVEISQQRKQRKHIVGTSQIYMRLAKPLREQVQDIITCSGHLFGTLQINHLIDGFSAVEKDGKLVYDKSRPYIWFRSPKLFKEYDTFAKMKRYNATWQGHKRDVKE